MRIRIEFWSHNISKELLHKKKNSFIKISATEIVVLFIIIKFLLKDVCKNFKHYNLWLNRIFNGWTITDNTRTHILDT